MANIPRITQPSLIVGTALLCLTLMAGCAGKQPSRTSGSQCPSGYYNNRMSVDPVFLGDLQDVKNDLARVSGTDAKLTIVAGESPNAFAWAEKKKFFIALNGALIKMLGENFDEYAFVLSHEMAHIKQGHIQKKAKYNKNVQQTGGILGLAMEVAGIGLGIPFSGLISSATVNSGSHLMKMGYSRDQEREADEVGLQYMTQAGFDPWAAVSFQQKLQKFSESNIEFLSSHPQTGERIENLKELIQNNSIME